MDVGNVGRRTPATVGMGIAPLVPAAPPADAVTADVLAGALASPMGESERVYVASPWRLIWWRFQRHKVALVAGIVIVLFYLVAIFAEFVAPYGPNQFSARLTYAPPTRPHFFDVQGRFHVQPFVYALKDTVDPVAFRREFTQDTSVRYPISLFVQGAPYKVLGVIPTNRHLFGVADPAGVVLLAGANRDGEDVFSRVVYGTRISMSIGLVAVAASLILGIIIGGISGFAGGAVDTVIQRIIEFLRSIPSIPLWLGLSAALPKNWSPLQTYFGITIVLSVIGWTDLARVVRGRFLTLREEQFVTAARLVGAGRRRIIFRHLLPSFTSHIIASVTLAIPGTILGETALSFLGIGLRPPVVSWGVLLQDAQNVRSVAQAPWLLLPGLAVVIAVLAFNFLGDGLRDAADPYAR
jgi:peptide/nickel transport system permease protein